ncbi:replication initiation protein [Paracoccus sp. PAMC 22219]|uniref:replication initiation protein n=1 Tax=Paracoccus sp. PAMC 22219 TaxID=1569209 RepID=UPI0005A73064|nr:replication initiation protein [Paracoccus sp. PAMC 22219]
MIKTLKVAADRAHDETKTVLPAEVARGVYIENPPSAEALKLMHLLIGTAGGRMADDVRHELRLADIKKIDGMRNHTRATMRKLFVELRGAVIVFDDTEAQCEIIGGFLDQATLDYRREVSDDLLVAWWFGRTFREMAEKSCHWAILDRQTVFALSSKYSILLFQHVASMVNLNHVTSKTFTVAELRAVMGVPEGKLIQFGHFNSRAIQSAISEINQTSRLTLTATPRKVGRTVVSVTLAWEDKPFEQKREAKRELDRPKIGRKARRDETAEIQVTTFPEAGSIAYSPYWIDLKRRAGCNVDNAKVATDFRRFLNERGISRNASNIEKLFSDFCRTAGKV